jgi:hypothetical protein
MLSSCAATPALNAAMRGPQAAFAFPSTSIWQIGTRITLAPFATSAPFKVDVGSPNLDLAQSRVVVRPFDFVPGQLGVNRSVHSVKGTGFFPDPTHPCIDWSRFRIDGRRFRRRGVQPRRPQTQSRRLGSHFSERMAGNKRGRMSLRQGRSRHSVGRTEFGEHSTKFREGSTKFSEHSKLSEDSTAFDNLKTQ